MYRCILFDMDGTLVDTYKGIYNSYKFTFEKMGMKFEGDDFVKKSIGPHLYSVFKKIFDMSDEKAQQALNYYRSYYSKDGKNEVRVYDGAKETLEKIKNKGIPMGVATLKRESFANSMLHDLGLIKYFDIVCGVSEKEHHETKSELVNRCLDFLKINKKEAILVGDTEFDAEGAAKSGVDFLPVLYGFGFKSENSLKKYKIEKYAKSFSDIYKILFDD